MAEWAVSTTAVGLDERGQNMYSGLSAVLGMKQPAGGAHDAQDWRCHTGEADKNNRRHYRLSAIARALRGIDALYLSRKALAK